LYLQVVAPGDDLPVIAASTLPVVVTGVIAQVHVVGLEDRDTGPAVAVNDVALDEKSAVRATRVDDHAVPFGIAATGRGLFATPPAARMVLAGATLTVCIVEARTEVPIPAHAIFTGVRSPIAVFFEAARMGCIMVVGHEVAPHRVLPVEVT